MTGIPIGQIVYEEHDAPYDRVEKIERMFKGSFVVRSTYRNGETVIRIVRPRKPASIMLEDAELAEHVIRYD